MPCEGKDNLTSAVSGKQPRSGEGFKERADRPASCSS